ncbi:chlororespiratory reduction protein 7 [Synechocystis sp. LKSZ1]|uniref:chlororespiratory reduction protein 7 n=1 Tax=Synechocystis sp. LKSZ1 TaxID=3144951 RepID=UPI00336C2966
MSNSLMYQSDMFVVLETDQAEQFLTPEELSQKLQGILQTYAGDLPAGVTKQLDPVQQADYLRDNYCDLDLGPEAYLQWYAVRLEK